MLCQLYLEQGVHLAESDWTNASDRIVEQVRYEGVEAFFPWVVMRWQLDLRLFAVGISDQFHPKRLPRKYIYAGKAARPQRARYAGMGRTGIG
jgi:hypothetical protein